MFRILLALGASFVATLAIGPIIIPWLKKLKFGQNVRLYGPKSHLKKQGVPTMGGIMITAVIAVVALAFSHEDGRLDAMLPAVIFIALNAVIGFFDDILKIKRANSDGLSAKHKTVLLLILDTAYALWLYNTVGPAVYLPFTDITWNLGWAYIPFAVIVMYATTNSANLLDGADGLLSGVTLVIAATLTLISYFAGPNINNDFPNMAVLSAALTGACLGFLVFNHYPARVIMGDTGSFAMGGAVTAIMLINGMPIFIPILAVMYVLTSASDIIQIVSYKTRRKRVFRMAPLHHHFELGGMKETRIVAMYMAITIVAAAVTFWATS